MTTNINIDDYIDCLLMKNKPVELNDGLITGVGFEALIGEHEKELNGKYMALVFECSGYYMVSLAQQDGTSLAVHSGMVSK